MNKILYFIASAVSYILYIKAPNEASISFSLICCIIFLIQAYTVVKADIEKDGLLSFNVIFLFSFFWVSYAFPLLVYGTSLDTRDGIEAFINYSVSSKCSALCTLAISIYFYSYSKHSDSSFTFQRLVKNEFYSGINLIYYVLFIGLFYHSFIYLRNVGGIAVDAGVWYSMYLACFPICLVNNVNKYSDNNWSSFFRHNAKILIPAFLLMLLYFVIGDRGLILIIGISIAAIYSLCISKIRPAFFLSAIIIGSILMFVLRETRNTDNSLSGSGVTEFASGAKDVVDGVNPVVVFSDLTGIHRELYIGYEYVERNGLIEPWQAVIVPFYPLPMVPNIMSKHMFNKTMDEIKPGMILNEYMAYTGHGHFGIHCVIDIFMRWGIVGIFVFFYLWGIIVGAISASKYNNTLCLTLYIILLASAIRIPRAPMLDMLRTFSYVVFFAWISSWFSRKY